MNKTILITGASSGIGKATAQLFSSKGWNVVATMRNPEKETELINSPNILVTQLEVTEPETIQNAISKGIEKFGRIDALLNNAGYGTSGIFESLTDKTIRDQFDVNVFGVMNVTRAIVPHFRAQQSGVIANITSGVGKIPFPLVSVYVASKYAVEGFVESLAYELDSQNIKVKIIEPGYIATNFQQRAFSDSGNNTVPEDYTSFLDETNALFSSLGAENTASAQEVAQTVFNSITDGTHQLRYIAGPDIVSMIEARNNKTDQEYVEFLRGMFAPSGFKNKI
jgi:NAD(P)-dependent dehydrogenase (short-subunit alcohol dehydrogenase family)